jgi:hypothetical protein
VKTDYAGQNAWKPLLSLATKQLLGVGLSNEDWTWGGGTVLMLRYEHRFSKELTFS